MRLDAIALARAMTANKRYNKNSTDKYQKHQNTTKKGFPVFVSSVKSLQMTYEVGGW